MAFDIENFPTSPKAKRMLSHVTKDFYDTSYVGKWLYQVMGLELDEIMAVLEELPKQAFPETATWGLGYHEFKWNLPVYTTDNYEERRQKIFEKRDYRAPMTPYKMEQHMQNMTGYQIRVADVHDGSEYDFRALWYLDGTTLLDGQRRLGAHPNRFQVYFIGDDSLGTVDIPKFMSILNRIKQSHTAYYLRQIIYVEMNFHDVETIKVPMMKIALGIETGNDLGVLMSLPILVYEPDEVLTMPSVITGVRILSENGLEIPNVGISFGFSFFGCKMLDGTWLFDGNTRLDSSIAYDLHMAARTAFNVENDETLGNGTVTRFSRNYWVLDGTNTLSGSRILDSVYEKEDL